MVRALAVKGVPMSPTSTMPTRAQTILFHFKSYFLEELYILIGFLCMYVLLVDTDLPIENAGISFEVSIYISV